MNSQCILEPLGTYGVPTKRVRHKDGSIGQHQPMMYLTTTDSEGKKKTSYVEQRIELTTAINKGNVYPYASTKKTKIKASVPAILEEVV
jgi:hypothetical protein